MLWFCNILNKIFHWCLLNWFFLCFTFFTIFLWLFTWNLLFTFLLWYWFFFILLFGCRFFLTLFVWNRFFLIFLLRYWFLLNLLLRSWFFLTFLLGYWFLWSFFNWYWFFQNFLLRCLFFLTFLLGCRFLLNFFIWNWFFLIFLLRHRFLFFCRCFSFKRFWSRSLLFFSCWFFFWGWLFFRWRFLLWRLFLLWSRLLFWRFFFRFWLLWFWLFGFWLFGFWLFFGFRFLRFWFWLFLWNGSSLAFWRHRSELFIRTSNYNILCMITSFCTTLMTFMKLTFFSWALNLRCINWWIFLNTLRTPFRFIFSRVFRWNWERWEFIALTQWFTEDSCAFIIEFIWAYTSPSCLETKSFIHIKWSIGLSIWYFVCCTDLGSALDTSIWMFLNISHSILLFWYFFIINLIGFWNSEIWFCWI